MIRSTTIPWTSSNNTAPPHWSPGPLPASGTASRDAWRLAPLLLPYLCLLALLAVIWGRVPAQSSVVGTPGAWLAVHIVVSVATYALCTLAAVAGTL